MTELKGVRRTVPPRLTRPSSGADVETELSTHLEHLAADLQEEGMEPEAARREARRRLGDVRKIRRQLRRIDRSGELKRMGWELWDSLRQDLRYALRQPRKSRGFTVVAVLTLALGIGLTTAMFTVVHGVLLRPLPFADPDRLVALGVQAPQDASLSVREAHYEEIERQATSFSGVSGYLTYPPTTLTGAGEAVRLTPAYVTPKFFDVLGVQPVSGSGFAPASDGSGTSSVVVLSDALWRSRLGADPSVVGRTAVLDGVPRTIVGVMPPGFDYPGRTDVWLPLNSQPMRNEGISLSYTVVARLRDGVSRAAAGSELEALGVASHWRIGRGGMAPSVAPTVRVFALKDTIVGDSRDPLLLFTGAVLLVLLIAWANVANLLLMRAATRQPEIGLRKVLGAAAPRLVRQLLTESLALAVMGGVLGIALAELGVRALLALAPAGTIPRGQEIGIDATVLGFVVAVSLLTGVAFGLAPAIRAGRRDLRDAIGHASRTHTRRRGIARAALVVSELGLAVVLLTGAGLLVRSFQQIRQIDLGFNPDHALRFYVDLPDGSYADTRTALALHRRVLDGLAALPAVEAVGASNFEAFGSLYLSTVIASEEQPDRPAGVDVTLASQGYFRAMGLPLVAGRGFTADDAADTPKVAVVSRGMARLLWPGGDAVGRRLSEGGQTWLVVGVAEDAVRSDPTGARRPLMYLPVTQARTAHEIDHMSYVVRTEASAKVVAPAMRAVVREADPNLPVSAVTSMDQVVLASLGDRLFQTRVLGVFAVLSMLLAAVGVYGVISYTVTERRRELGIRMALGARAGQVARLTLGDVLKLVVPGLVLGGVAAAATSRLVASSLYEVPPRDPVTFVAVVLLLGAAALIAALIPARRAARVDPVEVLEG